MAYELPSTKEMPGIHHPFSRIAKTACLIYKEQTGAPLSEDRIAHTWNGVYSMECLQPYRLTQAVAFMHMIADMFEAWAACQENFENVDVNKIVSNLIDEFGRHTHLSYIAAEPINLK